MDYRPEHLAREGNGAIQVDEAEDVPLKVFLAGPIKYWWGKFADGSEIWDSPEHKEYTEWRDAVRVAVVKTGWAVVYSPHRAIQGAWHDDLQTVNDLAITTSDVLLDLTPPGVPAYGTAKEVQLAKLNNIYVESIPPGHESDLILLIDHLYQKVLDL